MSHFEQSSSSSYSRSQPTFQCRLCRQTFHENSDLQFHIENIHYRDNRKRTKSSWRCEICHKTLCSKRSYLEHKNTHAQARPFKCEFCNYAAASQMTLRRHRLRQHVPRSDWHYRCPYCDQAFVEPTSYQTHLQHKHIGYSGTFGCDLCEYKTLSSRNFADHLQKHVRGEMIGRDGVPIRLASPKPVYRYLIEDELGVGWGQQPPHLAVDAQVHCLRRLTATEKPLSVHKSQRPEENTVRSLTNVRQTVTLEPGKNLGRDNNAARACLTDHEYQNGARISPTSLDEYCSVPEAEVQVEVETAADESHVRLKDDEPVRQAETEDDDDDDESTDDDTSSCSSYDSTLDFDPRLAASVLVNSLCENAQVESHDLGSHFLPDGQVDFDLD